MCDTQFGIHFERDPSLPLPPYVASSNHDEEDKEESRPVQEEPEYFPLVLPEDKDLITDYLYLAMEQMQPCEKQLLWLLKYLLSNASSNNLLFLLY
jgi:hypothetical protein